MIDTLSQQVARGETAARDLMDAEIMMARISIWDDLTHDEKMREREQFGMRSSFREVPGFEPRWCHDCHCEQFFDYREDPEGACMVCGAWDGQKRVEAA